MIWNGTQRNKVSVTVISVSRGRNLFNLQVLSSGPAAPTLRCNHPLTWTRALEDEREKTRVMVAGHNMGVNGVLFFLFLSVALVRVLLHFRGYFMCSILHRGVCEEGTTRPGRYFLETLHFRLRRAQSRPGPPTRADTMRIIRAWLDHFYTHLR